MARTRLATIAGIATLVTAALAAPAAAGPGTTTRWVDDDGKAGPNGCGGSQTAFTAIQPAIDASDRNDTIIVCPGTYTGQLSINGDRAGLTLKASDKWSARIRAPKADVLGESLVEVVGVEDVTIRHLELVFPTSSGCAIYADAIKASDAHGLRVMGTHIRPIGTNTLDCGYTDGIDLDDSRRVRISSNLIRDFRSDGMNIDDSRGVIHGNSIRFLHAAYDYGDDGSQGIELDDSRFRVSANVIRTRDDGSQSLPYLLDGIEVDDSPGSVIRDNVVRGATEGLELDDAGPLTVTRNRLTRSWVGIQVEGDADGHIIRGNDVRGNVHLDCRDESSGSGTAGTANTWRNNQGSSSDPSGICGSRR
ncbi:MAG: right-handed parallel beta-helix repeat-containing protein [Chloroflexi bacterium]|nr:right-handed parallel beta-helix repeat-containing protein [Chloroflexota bacterium]